MCNSFPRLRFGLVWRKPWIRAKVALLNYKGPISRILLRVRTFSKLTNRKTAPAHRDPTQSPAPAFPESSTAPPHPNETVRE